MLITFFLIFLTVACLAYANGANDNFKGVATLFGSCTTGYRGALAWGTATTFVGSLTALVLAEKLLRSFSGKGLVEGRLVTNPAYSGSVALGAGLTVLVATRIGMPISTTHSLVGALIGAGAASGSAIHWGQLGGEFFAPLLVSPVLALVGAGTLYPVLRFARCRLGITTETCICVGSRVVEVVPARNSSAAAALARAKDVAIEVGDTVTCRNRYGGRLLGFEAASALDRSHFLSAGAVSFARGLNDTPKIAALLLVAPSFGPAGGTALVGTAMALGGIISARRIARTMSHRITSMNHGQGFTANLVTSAVVIGASRLGLPVSTTHVSCGSLFAIGAVTGRGRAGMIGRILAAWVTTLPVAAMLGAASFWILGFSL